MRHAMVLVGGTRSSVFPNFPGRGDAGEVWDARSGPSERSVFRHGRVDLLGPGGDATLEVVQLAEAGFLQELQRARGAAAALALEHDFIRAIQLAHARGELAERDERGAGNAADVPLEGLAHVDEPELVATIQLRF